MTKSLKGIAQRGALAAVVAAAAAIAPTAASAATVNVDDAGRAGYYAAPGEVNNVTVTEINATTVDFRDPGVAMAPGAGCFRVSVDTVRCQRSDIRYSKAFLGDRDDRLTQVGQSVNTAGNGVDTGAPGVELYASGNEGNDTIIVQSGYIWAAGNEGDDTLLGGSSNDTLLGDLVGGAGNAGRDLVRGNGGNDLLTGDGGPDRLEGGAGRDELIGETGNDLLIGGSDVDKFDAGAGGDIVRAADRNAERILCGDGRDQATLDGNRVDSSLGCEVRTYSA